MLFPLLATPLIQSVLSFVLGPKSKRVIALSMVPCPASITSETQVSGFSTIAVWST